MLVLFCFTKWVFIFSVPGWLLQEADVLICTDGHTRDGGFPSDLAERARFLH